mmetsp:Transcript_14495/g.21263  ORF Transcript_14495/g.21263 Transcript_14495/m.21263 type:complete len:374 (+) Transcript_14495:134-1255(+)
MDAKYPSPDDNSFEQSEHGLFGSESGSDSQSSEKVPLTRQAGSIRSPSLPTPNPAQDAVKLAFGAGGIYASFLYYGSLQEDVFNHVAEDGSSFKQAWFLQVLEAAANVIVGAMGLYFSGATKNIPQKFFVISGASQVSSKAFTSLSLAHGLSFPVATLAKSGKMAPVMAGQLLLGGASYGIRDYMQVAAIVLGTAILSLGKKKGGESHSTLVGLFFILLSLTMDGVTGGLQKRLKADMNKVGIKPKPYDFMFWTNLYMMIVAIFISFVLGEFTQGIAYCVSNADLWSLIIKFSICSAIGQSFIFYTVAHFDPLVCSTVTTTRKIFSVLLSIFTKGHQMSLQGWFGVSLAVSGILSEVHNKVSHSQKLKSKVSM